MKKGREIRERFEDGEIERVIDGRFGAQGATYL